MQLYRPAAVVVLLTATVVSSLQQPSSSYPARNDGGRRPQSSYTAPSYNHQQHHRGGGRNRRLTPAEIHYDPRVSEALTDLRSAPPGAPLPAALRPCFHVTPQGHAMLSLTLVGYKGGSLQSQVNQDRAVIEQQNNSRLVMAVCDGHAPRGELVSQYAVEHLSRVLAQQLRSNNNDMPTALHHTFVQLDHDVPAHPSGGCTATVLVYEHGRVTIANAGDSRTLLCAYHTPSQTASVLFTTRDDKPCLPDERARVEAAGGSVYIPHRGTSRVVYHDAVTGAPTGLAMSRSLGDWDAATKGVIPDPVVNQMDMEDLVGRARRMRGRGSRLSNVFADVQNIRSDVVSGQQQQQQYGQQQQQKAGAAADEDEDDGICIFAICATDGVIDYTTPQELANRMGHALFSRNSETHPLTAAEHILYTAAERWQADKMGLYRDDCAIAVATLRRPPVRMTGE